MQSSSSLVFSLPKTSLLSSHLPQNNAFFSPLSLHLDRCRNPRSPQFLSLRGAHKKLGLRAVAAQSQDATTSSSDVIVIRVTGMVCDGCSSSVKRILESQPQVSSATVDLQKATAFVSAVPEVKVTQDWQKEVGEKLAKHLTTCGFKSNIQGSS